MALKGSFNWYNSIQQGGKKAISFTLYCDNLFQTETFDCAIIDSAAQVTPQIRRQITLKFNKQYCALYFSGFSRETEPIGYK